MAGTTNILFFQRENWYDLAIHLPTKEIKETGKQYRLSKSDKEFMVEILEDISKNPSEDWLRDQFEKYTMKFFANFSKNELKKNQLKYFDNFQAKYEKFLSYDGVQEKLDKYIEKQPTIPLKKSGNIRYRSDSFRKTVLSKVPRRNSLKLMRPIPTGRNRNGTTSGSLSPNRYENISPRQEEEEEGLLRRNVVFTHSSASSAENIKMVRSKSYHSPSHSLTSLSVLDHHPTKKRSRSIVRKTIPIPEGVKFEDFLRSKSAEVSVRRKSRSLVHNKRKKGERRKKKDENDTDKDEIEDDIPNLESKDQDNKKIEESEDNEISILSESSDDEIKEEQNEQEKEDNKKDNDKKEDNETKEENSDDENKKEQKMHEQEKEYKEDYDKKEENSEKEEGEEEEVEEEETTDSIDDSAYIAAISAVMEEEL